MGDNSVINLMPGTYSGVNNSDLTANVNNLTITSYQGPAIFTPAAGSAPVRYFNLTGSNVVLNGLTFISGVSMAYEDTIGGEVIIDANNVIVNNTKFINSLSKGGTLYVTADNTIIQNSLFDNNTVNTGDGAGAYVKGGNLTVIGSTFKDNDVNNGAAGAIYFIGNNLLVNTSLFTSNSISVGKGGAIYSEANTRIYNSKFFNQSTGSANGGAVYVNGDNLEIENVLFEKNSANGGLGGALKFNGTNLTINKSNFTDNFAQGQSGGAVYSNAELAKVNNSYFDSNNAWNGAGGAIYNVGEMLIVDNSTFYNHVATSRNGAGVIYMDGSLNITNSNFTKNYGYTGIGAVHQLNGDLYVNNTLFDSNQGWSLNGGAIYTENSDFLIENSNFTANTAGGYGGAIYGENSNGTVQDNIFDKNLGNNGAGAVHLVGDNYTIQRNNFSNGPRYSVGFVILRGNNNVVDSCNFANGTSQNSIGGAVASYGENLTVTNCNMYNVSSSSVGGMIYSKGNNTFIENCTLNKSETNYGVIFIEGDNPVINNITMTNAQTNVGAIHLRSNNATVTNSYFDECKKTSYGNGGVIFWTGTTFGKTLSLDTLVVDNCTFVECNGEGGYNTAVTAFGNNVLVNNSDFINCSSPYCGAIIYRGTNATISNSNFDGCQAEVQAGAISMSGTNVVVDGCNFTNNWALMSGGAIYSTATNSNITNNLFVNNTVGSDGNKHIRGRTTPVSEYPGDGGSIIIMGGNNVRIVNNTICNASMNGYGGAIENRGNNIFSNNTIYNTSVTRDGGAIMNYGSLDDRSSVTNCHADGTGSEIYNLGMEGPVYMILDEKPRYLYVNESTIIPVGLVNDHGATVTVRNVQGLVSDENGHIMFYQFSYNEASDNRGMNVTFDTPGVYVFKPLARQQSIYLAEDNSITIYVVNRMPVEIDLPEITAYPRDVVDYTFNITNPNGLLIRNGTVWMVINDHNYTAEILNGKVNITDHDLSGQAEDVKYSADYAGNITFKNVQLYDEAKVHNVTAYYVSNCNYYADSSQNGTIEILPLSTYIPEVKIKAYVRDKVTFTIDVKSESGRTVEGNVSFYLPSVLAGHLESDYILNTSKLGEFEGILFTVELRNDLTLTIPVESEFRLPIFYYGNHVFSESMGLLNISSHRNPTQVLSPIIHAEVGIPFELFINVTSRYVVDENMLRVIFDSEPVHYYDVPIRDGYVSRMMALYMPGTYVNPVIYTGGQSFLGSNNVTIIIVALVNVSIDVDDINTFPGDIRNITVNLTDKYGNKVLNGTVNTTINGKDYFADVINGTATFVDVLLDDKETEYEFSVSYTGNNYYNNANATAIINLVKINTEITTSDIAGLPGDNRPLNITLMDMDGNVLNYTVKVKYDDGTIVDVDLTKENNITLANPGHYEIKVNFEGNVKYNPSNATINVFVSPLNTTVVGKDVKGYPKQLVDIAANVTDEKGNPVLNGTAILTIVPDCPYYAQVINGSATFKDVELPEREGDYQGFIYYYDENEYYNPSQTYINITVAKINTNITSNDTKGRTGEKVNITANITDIDGNPILEGSANFTIDGEIYTADIINGTATFVDVVLPNPGNYTANITYSGSVVYNPSNTTVDVTVLKLDTDINADNVAGMPNEKVNITANVTDMNGSPVVNGTATLTIDGVNYTADVLNGSVTFKCVVLPNPGNYTVPINYEGTEIYNPSNTTIAIEVLKVDSNTTANPVSGKTGETVNVTANVTDIDGNPIINGTATLDIDGTNYTANITDGTVTFVDVVLPNPGNYTADITYPGDDYYNPSNTTVDIAVSKLDTVIEADDVYGYPKDVVVIIANVTDENGNPVLNGTAILIIGDKIGEAPKGFAAAGEYVAQVKDGKAVFEGVILPNPGVYPGDLMYLGDDVYNPSNSSIKINVLKLDSEVTADNVTGKAHEPVNITANVTDSKGNPIVNGTATLTINGTNYTAPIVNGTVTFENVDLPAGSHNGFISYPGDDIYNPSNTTVNVNISKVNTNISADPIKGNQGDKRNVTVNIIDEDGNPVLNGTATLIIDGVEYNAEVHNGTATFIDVILPNSTTTAIVKYNGNEYYSPSETTLVIEIISVDPVNNETADVNGTINKQISSTSQLKAAGNPIFVLLLVLMMLISNNILRRKR